MTPSHKKLSNQWHHVMNGRETGHKLKEKRNDSETKRDCPVKDGGDEREEAAKRKQNSKK